MMIVTGSVRIRFDKAAEALALSREHVRLSRKEDGCLSHAVLVDPDDPLQLFFFEEWSDREALSVHFQDPRCRDFVDRLSKLSVEAPALSVYEAEILGR